MRYFVACGAPYGAGGLGQMLAQVVEEVRADGNLAGYYARGVPPEDETAYDVAPPLLPFVFKYTPARFDQGWKNHFGNVMFDQAVAARLPSGDRFTGFVGQTLRCFQRARRLGYTHLEVEAANSHVDNVRIQHEKARRQHSFETSWLNGAQVARTKKEYMLADRIVACSEYTRQTFLERGFDPDKVRMRRLITPPRYTPPASRPDDGVFRVVYVGSVTVFKGVPVLVEAFARLKSPQAELTLVGGWATRGMKEYLSGWQARDPRIKIAPGNPIPHLHRANVCVHPSYEDGWAYAPAEALACNVPVVVTQETGMKDIVREGENGYIVPSGDSDALLERMEHIRQYPLVVQPTDARLVERTN